MVLRLWPRCDICTYQPKAPALHLTPLNQVASVDTESFPAPVAKISGNSPPWDMGYLPAGDIPFSTNGSLTFFATSADFMDPNDACEPLPETTPDLSRKLVLISLGRCTLEIKERYAALKGAKYIWFYSQEGNPVTNPAIRGVLKSKGQGMITGEVARKILADINAGVNITASFTDNQITWLPNVATGGKISKSSSWGPGSEGEISPVGFSFKLLMLLLCSNPPTGNSRAWRKDLHHLSS